ncbi:MAG: DUF4105 domain-containing protein [Hahellaceae bacterium]|nr:DUF4105 domain-containing protein [Hahellaceae bacterium]MCP5168770.1 DUF4105 domain-containing protein [Hahellaceae bacterium]
MLFRYVVFIVGIFLNFPILAEPVVKSSSAIYQQKAIALSLANDPLWLALIHYYPATFSSSGFKSYVDDAGFFLSVSGETDPQAELLTTINALFAAVTQPDEHAICRFPYRAKWIQEQLGISANDFPDVSCTDYQQWREQVNAVKASLIFPAAYLNSPSSMFGHTLLRFDPADVDSGSDWLSWALNFGANINMEDNSLFYAYRGLAGGYPGVYNMMRYFEKIKEYNYMENRDMWEYQLNLTQDEVDRMLSHVWELKNINFDYYFLDENCSFRLLELLELVRPESRLIEKFPLATIPIDTVRAVIEEEFVARRVFRPSEALVLNERIHGLNDDEKRLAKALAEDATLLDDEPFLSLSDDRKGEVVQVAYSYARFEQRKVARDTSMAKRSFQLLQALNKTPSKPVSVPVPAAPDLGHKSSLLGVGGGYQDDRFYSRLTYRYNYHDLLDRIEGYQQGAAIMAGRLDYRHYEGGLGQLERLDVIDIFSLSDWNLFMHSPSWRVQAGYERVMVGEENRDGAYQVNAGVGLAVAPMAASKIYSLAEARLEHTSIQKAFINTGVGARLGYLWYADWGTQQVEASGTYFLDDSYRARLDIKQNWVLGTQHALRLDAGLEFVRDVESPFIEASYRFYF